MSMSFPAHLVNDIPPRNFGSPRHGTLKAAQWRTAGCFSLLATLTRAWSTGKAQGDAKLWLENFHHLVALSRIAYQLSVSEEDINVFQFHSMEYIKGIHAFGVHHIKPSHHLLLHLGDIMRRYGPMRGWWAFPFERFNGIIQDLETNHKSGRLSFESGKGIMNV
jgi:hypothetical protein